MVLWNLCLILDSEYKSLALYLLNYDVIFFLNTGYSFPVKNVIKISYKDNLVRIFLNQIKICSIKWMWFCTT